MKAWSEVPEPVRVALVNLLREKYPRPADLSPEQMASETERLRYQYALGRHAMVDDVIQSLRQDKPSNVSPVRFPRPAADR